MGSAVNRRQIACQTDGDGGSLDLRYVGNRKNNISCKMNEGRNIPAMNLGAKRFLPASSGNVLNVKTGR
jgi:hypothetical protein